MKFRFFVLYILAFILSANAQQLNLCGTTEFTKKWLEEHPELANEYHRKQQEAANQDALDAQNNYSAFKNMAAPAYTIPVVFHILHLNGPENISDAQVLDAITILNRDFRKLNADTNLTEPEFKALAADANIQFALATKDESGNCTNGIVRHYDPHTNWIVSSQNYIYTWSPNKYLNIYVVNDIQGAAGYTFLPGTVSAFMDAIVMRHDYIGSVGTAHPYRSRALTHEAGHWLNLQHVWGYNNNPGVTCGDDGVSDTPVTKGFGWCNLISASVCNPPNKENVQNYMEYSYCSTMFTIGQATRMNNCLLGGAAGRNNLHTNSNLIATGVINPLGPCKPIVDFAPAKPEVCVGGSVMFNDLSYNGTVTAWNWYFQNGTANSLTIQNPSVTFNVSGLNDIKLKAGNSVGADSLTKKAIIVLGGPGSGTNSVVQGFEFITFPASNWLSKAPEFGSDWIQTFTVGASGTSCLWVNNFFESPSDPVNLYTPMYDISTLQAPTLAFDVAYAQSPSGSNDRLRVYYSTDCAATWNTLYNKSGSLLHTLGSGNNPSSPLLIPLPTQWRHEHAFLTPAGTTNSLLLKFEFTPDSLNPGNNIFIDNINILSTAGIADTKIENNRISVYPNPASESIIIKSNFELANAYLTLTDVTGKIVFTEKDFLFSGDSGKKLNIASLEKGMYFIHLQGGEQHFAARVVIQ